METGEHDRRKAVHAITHLCPSHVWRNQKLDVSMPKDAKNHAPEIPLSKATTTFEQLDSGFLLAGFVLGPRLSPISTSLVVFGVILVLFPSLGRKESRKDEDGFYVKFFEGTQIGFDTLG